ncbi:MULTISPECIES: hypothetical protein [unclassified Brenneria]|uniref:hypothetical protein n=1 Tax=unclassified Brenneria TaxID=2634434 RepID=UPI0029C5D0F6|nr:MULTISPECIES: hypothetical protein [unclassified Brenneria]MDX5628229.1 hypothetical protein [Brenneria sp. L3-3Z]MDX5695588.1 hypothetical protein [Brenneria sp. L4-2C]MEE3662437.1 hypothetical protein [Brenneria sp. g21c3]
MGGALGVNLLSVFIERRGALHGEILAESLTRGNAVGTDAIRQLNGLYAHWGNPFGEPLGANPGVMEFMQRTLASKAQMFAYQDGFYMVAMCFFAAIIPALFIRGRVSRLKAIPDER